MEELEEEGWEIDVGVGEETEWCEDVLPIIFYLCSFVTALQTG